jgi:hypothetical protein
MATTSQQRAVRTYRQRLAQRGLVRFEVLGRADDRALVQALARKLATTDPAAAQLRTAVRQALAADQDATDATGGILAALRRSPLVGAELDLRRPRTTGRAVEL